MAKAKYYRRPDGLYETIKTVNGKRVAFRGRTVREVDQKILDYKEAQAKGRLFPVVADEWLAEIEKTIRNSTYKVYSKSLERLSEAFPGSVKSIKPIDVKRYLQRFGDDGYAKQTVKVELNVFKQILSHAVIAGDIDVSPAVEVKVSRGLPQKKRSTLTEEQEAKVATFRGDNWLLGAFLMFTGMRRGELMALRWEDVDRKEKVIHVNKKVNYSFGNHGRLENFLKSERGRRDVPLLDSLSSVLPRNRIGLVFPDPDDGGIMTARHLLNTWEAYCRDVGLAETVTDDNGKTKTVYPITPHCFRHTFRTICFEAGATSMEAAAWMGDTEEVSNAVYTHLREAKAKRGVDCVNDYLAERAAAL